MTQQVTHIKFTDEGRVAETRTEEVSPEDAAKEVSRGATNTVVGGAAAIGVGVGAVCLLAYSLVS